MLLSAEQQDTFKRARRIGWIGFWVMLIGTAMAATMILLNKASVLYTFYAPLQAHWILLPWVNLCHCWKLV